MKTKKEENHALEQAKAQLKSVRTLVSALITEDDDAQEKAREAIQDDALSVEVKTGWNTCGSNMIPEEYRIVLCTGGPHVQISGDLDIHNQPHTARIEYQDWFTGMTTLETSTDDDDALLTYAQQFYFGE